MKALAAVDCNLLQMELALNPVSCKLETGSWSTEVQLRQAAITSVLGAICRQRRMSHHIEVLLELVNVVPAAGDARRRQIEAAFTISSLLTDCSCPIEDACTQSQALCPSLRQ